MRDLLRRLLSWAAQFTPNSVYYSPELAIRLNEAADKQKIPMVEDGEVTSMNSAALMMAVSASKHLPDEGDKLTSRLRTATHGGFNMGNFRVGVTRLTEEEADF